MGVFGSNMSQSRVGKDCKGVGAYQWSIPQLNGISSGGGGSAFEICVTPPAGMLFHLGRFGFRCLSTSQLMSSPARPSLLPERQQVTSIGALTDLMELDYDIVSSQLSSSLLEQTRSQLFSLPSDGVPSVKWREP